MPPDQVISTLKDSALRGRGGAGFPTGVKWGFIPQGDGKPHYLVVNADESEPGACKDMPTLLNNPQALIEGIIIACYAIRAREAFIYVRGEVLHVIRRLHLRRGRGAGRRLPRREHPRLRPQSRCGRARGRRSLHLRRGDRAAGLARGLPRPAPAQAAVPGRRGAVRLPDGRQQRRVDRHRALHPSVRRRPSSPASAPRSPRASGCSRCPATSPPPASTRRRSAPRCASCWTWPAGSGPGTG